MSSASPLLVAAVRRIASGIALVFAASVLVFAGTTLLPGDAAEVLLSSGQGGAGGSNAQIQALRTELGLDRAWPVRYVDWLTGLLRGDLGTSLLSGRSVTEIIGERLGNTLILTGMAGAALVPIAIGLGIWAALRQGRFADRIISTTSIGLHSLPEFVMATLLIAVFALGLQLVPPVSMFSSGDSPLSQPEMLILPVASLLSVMAAQSIRMVRARATSVVDADFVRAARWHGIPERRVVWRYVLPNALAPALQLLAISFAWMIGGVVVVEQVFGYPGISDEFVAAVGGRDEPVVQALAIVIATSTVVAFTAADLLAMVIVPKLRESRS